MLSFYICLLLWKKRFEFGLCLGGCISSGEDINKFRKIDPWFLTQPFLNIFLNSNTLCIESFN